MLQFFPLKTLRPAISPEAGRSRLLRALDHRAGVLDHSLVTEGGEDGEAVAVPGRADRPLVAAIAVDRESAAGRLEAASR